MNSAGNIGGPEPLKGGETSGAQETGGEPSQQDIAAAMKAPIHTLGEMKSVLTRYLGEKDGTKLYNQFMQSFAIAMLNQLRTGAKAAEKAAKGMSGQTPT